MPPFLLGLAVEDRSDARQAGEHGFCALRVAASTGGVNVRDLVIGHGERAAGEEIGVGSFF